MVATQTDVDRLCSGRGTPPLLQDQAFDVRHEGGVTRAREVEKRELHHAPRRQKPPPPGTRPAPVQEVRQQEGIQRHTGVGFELVFDPVVPQTAEQLVEVFAPAPAVFQASSPVVVEHIAPAPSVVQAPTPVVKYIAPVPAVFPASPVVEYIAFASGGEYCTGEAAATTQGAKAKSALQEATERNSPRPTPEELDNWFRRGVSPWQQRWDSSCYRWNVHGQRRKRTPWWKPSRAVDKFSRVETQQELQPNPASSR